VVRVLLAAFLVLTGCATLPPLEGRPASSAIDDPGATRLATAVAPLVAAHPGQTGIYAMPSPSDAFASRMLLAAAAERTLDVQYYIWHGDETGLLLFEALHEAAARGVRVRLLVDDQNTRGIEDVLRALGVQPTLEVRLYNPFANRGVRAVGYFGDFERLNRRMHNKAFIADNRAAIVGGRNIGNEYFAAGGAVPFIDLDVLAIGASVREVSAQFDLYWSSASAYPGRSLLGERPADAAALLRERFASAHASPDAREFLDAVRETPLVRQLLARALELEWAEARLVYDDPAKTLDREQRRDVLLLSRLAAGGSRPTASFDLISPYFVPGERGSAFLEELAAAGVRVRVLTNSLAATDVSVVHSGYAKRRCRLARAGVKLYELKPSAAVGKPKKKKDDDDAPGSSGASSLHAKTFAVDDARIFVGSFNFDPRSALLNTEMGLVISSAALARRLDDAFQRIVPMNAYEVRPREGEACIEWVEHTATADVVHDTEPQAGWGRRAWLQFLMLLPLDWML
jgi:phosphatidylserine/phosphatidylglycerophosphate/cardiolipin synthase-like enzyme